MNIVEVLLSQGRERPDAPAIIDVNKGRERIISFAQLEMASARAAALLQKAGLREGDPVLVFQPMSVELYVALLAIFRLGLVATFLDPSSGRTHIENCCRILPPKAFIASAKAHLLRLTSGAIRRIPRKFVIGCRLPGATSWNAAQDESPIESIAPCQTDSAALVTFTSGSTGQPKATLRSHGFLLAQHRVLQRSIDLVAGEIDLTTLPIFILANLGSGVTSLIPDADLRKPGGVNPNPILAQIARWNPTRTAASPAFLQQLASAATSGSLSGFRKIYTGGAPVFPPLLSSLQLLAPKAEVVAVFGSSEAEPIAHISHEALESYGAIADGSGLLVGAPVAEIAVRILPDNSGAPMGPFAKTDFELLALPPGSPGEIAVAGPHVLGSYLNGHGNQETKIAVDGTTWHRTGDAGYLDTQGRLWLLGRCAAKISDSRGCLYPFAVECAAQNVVYPRRCALVSVRGRRILAVESTSPLLDEERTQLASLLSWAELDEIRAIASIPVDKRHNAKVLYDELRTALLR